MKLSPEQLDEILTIQLVVAWAGESGEDEPRLRWWNTDMVSEFGGRDLFARLTPTTAEWAIFEVIREAARRVDAKARRRDSQPDRLISLFRMGFEIDEQLRDRLRELKHAGKPPQSALPELGRITQSWDQSAFEAWLGPKDDPIKVVEEPSGRRLTTPLPADPVHTIRQLAHALLPLCEDYPCPHFRDDDAIA